MSRPFAGRLTVGLALACIGWLPLPGAGDAVAEPAQLVQVSEALDKLSDNEAVVLGRARVEGDFNAVARRFGLDRTGPRRRDYCLKMVWAEDRKTALYLGANHGQPHRLNDVWEFDLGRMAWVMLYAPDNPRSYRGLGDDPSDVEFRDGLLITKRGGPAVIAHTWSGTTYDPVNHRLLFMDTWLTREDEAIRDMGGDPKLRYRGPPLWSFDPAARKWAPIKTEPPGPAAPFGAMLEYVSALGGAVWHMNNWQMRATWLFEPTDRRWTQLPANAGTNDFASQAPSKELVGYYDPVRKWLVAQQGTNTFHFDVTAKRWVKVLSGASTEQALPNGNDARTVFYHDPVSGHGLLVDLHGRALWAYDPDAIKWNRLVPRGAEFPNGDRMLAYLDRSRNVLVVISDTLVWAYRYRRGS
ncbi:MAG: hypothetical protein H6959_08670 [Chromatiaceae bacterium]|nr:hypothetical protein [Gammaproteobacteria bacterium]MCP5422981.1 hypothetical protein [Chromatiaceae bacterium]